jgi:preprotein translocase subunit YajC
MFSFLVDNAHAMGAQGQAAAGGENPILGFMPFILIMVVFYFLMIRPQQKRQKEHEAMLGAIQRGDEVVTTGGLMGKVTGVTDDALTIEIAQNIKVKVLRTGIASVKK